jgi:SAM-dependent methyltransferase
MKKEILNLVNEYYTEKIKEHGATPKGVDWNGEESQMMRFVQLSKVIEDNSDKFSLLDFGCGYGGMIDYLEGAFGAAVKYFGFDISEEMILSAKDKYGEKGTFFSNINNDLKYDYTVASGIFNVRQEIDDANWEEYVFETLNSINSKSLNGFSFNMLTSYSDKEFMKSHLYYASPEKIFAYCKSHFSSKVALLHDYPLYEFTVVVKK